MTPKNWSDGPSPDWWNKIPSRIIRGAIASFTSNLNSGLTHHHKSGRKLTLPLMTKKRINEMLSFDDGQFPCLFRNLKSIYNYTTKDKKRTNLDLNQIIKLTRKRGFNFVHEKDTGRYYLYYPVDAEWCPPSVKRIENQDNLISEGETIIALDPGVRKFMVGYDPRGKSIFIGEDANRYLLKKLEEIDRINSLLTQIRGKTVGYLKRIKRKLWRQVKNKIDELHWKTIRFLTRNYDVIMLPDFRVSEMLRKKKLGHKTKRMLSMFSFYKFKERLIYKCKVNEKRLIIVGEEYTSCTCGKCGKIRKVKGEEIYKCEKCGVKIDRDVNGSRNILIKNIGIRLSPSEDVKRGKLSSLKRDLPAKKTESGFIQI